MFGRVQLPADLRSQDCSKWMSVAGGEPVFFFFFFLLYFFLIIFLILLSSVSDTETSCSLTLFVYGV